MPKNRDLVKSHVNRRLQKPHSSFLIYSAKRRITKKTHKRPMQRPLSHKRNAFAYYRDLMVQSPYYSLLQLLMKFFFIAGVSLMLLYLGLRLNQEIQLAYFTPKVTPVVTQADKIYAIPKQIAIAKVNIDLSIDETAISNGVWQVSEKGASHLNISARPGQEGSIILYGHNTDSRFGPIRWLSKGDRIEIITDDGKNHAYKIQETMRVKSERVDVLTKEKGETLILYTCDGFADLDRFVIIAKPTKAP